MARNDAGVFYARCRHGSIGDCEPCEAEADARESERDAPSISEDWHRGQNDYEAHLDRMWP